MKRIISFLLVLAIVVSFAAPAFASEVENDVEVEWIECQLEEPWVDEIMPRATLALDFSNLAPDGYKRGSEVYYIDDAYTYLKVISASWNSQDEEVGIGWYNTKTNIIYFARYKGGSVTNKRINSSGLPEGNYNVVIMNLGDLNITGNMQYTVS